MRMHASCVHSISQRVGKATHIGHAYSAADSERCAGSRLVDAHAGVVERERLRLRIAGQRGIVPHVCVRLPATHVDERGRVREHNVVPVDAPGRRRPHGSGPGARRHAIAAGLHAAEGVAADLHGGVVLREEPGPPILAELVVQEGELRVVARVGTAADVAGNVAPREHLGAVEDDGRHLPGELPCGVRRRVVPGGGCQGLGLPDEHAEGPVAFHLRAREDGS
mmetsp:Transcript_11258/g.38378  ORF Transcript_11258/g.38378 Transcript_11258/m.38378 type:complete len:223 (+) Transcript_11258:244-912(+)